MLAEPLAVVAAVARSLEGLQIDYVVGGSLASSIFGVPRATQDVDIVATIAMDQVAPLVAALEPDFFVDADSLGDAIRRNASTNIFHRATAMKVDLFIPAYDAWIRSEMSRARVERIGRPPQQLAVRFASPEDVLLHKLWWYKSGGEVSERQWRDVQGVLKIQGSQLDHSYLQTWAEHLDVGALLARATRDAGGRE